MQKISRMKLESIPTGKIKVGKYKLRSIINDDAHLKSSLYKYGQISPVIVLKDNSLISGFRRYDALRKIGTRNIWALKIDNIKGGNVLDYQLNEVLHTKDLNPIDKGRIFKQMLDKNKISIRSLAKIINISRSTIEWHLRLLKLTPDIIDDIRKEKIRPYSRLAQYAIGNEKIRNIEEIKKKSNEFTFESLKKRLWAIKSFIKTMDLDSEKKLKICSILDEIKKVMEDQNGK